MINLWSELFVLQALAMFFASLCHDLDHRGRTNSWMKNEQTPLAAVYSTSTMEHHHFNQTITILQVCSRIAGALEFRRQLYSLVPSAIRLSPSLKKALRDTTDIWIVYWHFFVGSRLTRSKHILSLDSADLHVIV